MFNDGIMTTDTTKFEHCQEFVDDMVKTITDFGCKFQGVGYVSNRSERGYEGGVWIFKFELPEDRTLISNDGSKLKQEFMDALTQDDDSQPSANYRIYMGDVWMFAPYYC